MEGAWVVIPTRNERGNIGQLIAELLGPSFDIRLSGVVVVDDSSTDGTAAEVDSLRTTYGNLHLIRRQGPPSFGGSYLEGIRFALSRGAQLVLQMDADGSHRSIDAPILLRALGSHDLAVGSRYVGGGRIENWGLIRRGVSAMGNRFARSLLALPLRDATSGFIAWRAGAVANIAAKSCPYQGYVFLVYLKHAAIRTGLRVAEVPITFVERRAGQSKFRLGIIAEAALALVRLARSKP